MPSKDADDGCCRACCGQWLIVTLYWAWAGYAACVSPWHMFEDSRPGCANRKSKLPVNDSGVQVLVYGLRKTGTTSMIRSIYDLGFDHAYHSEDLSLHVVSPLADLFWLRRENGGRRAGMAHAIFERYGRSPDNLNLAYSNDTRVLESLRTEELAASLAGCRVDAIAFDGMEHLFWHIYNVSPAAKVLILDWRTVAEWNASRIKFFPLMLNAQASKFAVLAGLLGAPWVLAVKGLDRLFGSEGYRLLAEGGPPMRATADPGVVRDLYLAALHPRRVAAHAFAGLLARIRTREEYDDFYKIPYERIPPERRMSWDMRRHGYEDLCAFLGIPAKDCPKKGLLPNALINWDSKDVDPRKVIVSWSVYFAFHLVNVYVFSAGLTALRALFRIARGSVGGSCPSNHVE